MNQIGWECTKKKEEIYVKNTAKAAYIEGMTSYVINHRGIGAPLTSPRTYSTESYEDYAQALEYIKSQHPELPIFGVGFSMGGVIMGRYLGKYGDQSGLAAAASLNTPLDSHAASEFVEKTCGGFYTRFLAKLLQNTKK